MPASPRINSAWKGQPEMARRWYKRPAMVSIFSHLIAGYIRLVHATARVEYQFDAAAAPYIQGDSQAIFTFWHGRMMMMPCLSPKNRRVHVMISHHGDGEIIARAMERFGFGLVRGSSRKGAVGAAIGALEILRAGDNLSITPDGPRGPFQCAAPGAAALAVKAGVPIIPVTFSATWHARFRSWDRFMLALPFSRIIYVVGAPMMVQDIETGRAAMETALRVITHRADHDCHYRPLPLRLYRAFTRWVRPFLPLYLHARTRRGKETRGRIAERFGIAGSARPVGPVLWLHAASMGESFSALKLLHGLRARFPQLNILVTTGTVTSAHALPARLPEGSIHQFMPLDAPLYVQQFLDHWRPDMALVMESELWPNLLHETHLRGVPAWLVNGRMSARSFARWRLLPRAAKTMLARFDTVLAQSEADAERFRTLGAERVLHLGNLKRDTDPLPCDENLLSRYRDLLRDRPVWLAASTHPGEEIQILDAHIQLQKILPDILTIIVPRHADRGGEVEMVAQRRGIATDRRARGELFPAEGGVYIADTMGELGLWYRLCDVVFIGGSLVPHGGQNPMEPAQLGCAILTGPHTKNFDAVMADLRAHHAILEINNVDSLTKEVRHLLTTHDARKTLASNALAFMEAQRGITECTVEAISEILTPLFTAEKTHARA